MDRQEYLSSVNEFFYQGEVLGEAFFGRCVELEADPVRRWKWANLQQLETETKARLRPFMMRLGLSIVQSDVAAQVAQFTDGFADKSWAEHMQLVADATGFYLGKFREIAAAAPQDDREMAEAMIAHETALNNFANRELAGDGVNSLADVLAQLHGPIEPPAA